jgi:hypothetical protein
MLVLNHQDGELRYKFEEGGFAIVDSKLYVSIETKAIDEDTYPDRFLFAIEGLLLKNGLENTHFEISINPNYEPPNVHVYTTYHADQVTANVKLTVLTNSQIEIEIDIKTEDVIYYNEKAKPNFFKGNVILPKKDLEELWIPS